MRGVGANLRTPLSVLVDPAGLPNQLFIAPHDIGQPRYGPAMIPLPFRQRFDDRLLS